MLTAELFRAWELLDTAPDRLCAPPTLTEHTTWALATAAPPEEGRLRGRLLALTAALKDAGTPDTRIWPRPITTPHHTGYAIGLGTTPPETHRLAEIGAEVLRGLKGASLCPGPNPVAHPRAT
ncbi:hypothetical protein [Streptomyces sp. NBC_00441]|uniref:hypothetical protein n=1 Tax=Streptomyces sp. NBC_00441 TaxID=2975742 RepID=UPI003FCCCBB1